MRDTKATEPKVHTTEDVIRIVQEAILPLKKEVAEAVVATILEIQKQNAPRPLLSVREVAERLGVSVRTVETLIAEGSLTPIRIRNARRFTEEQTDAFLRQQAKKSRR